MGDGMGQSEETQKLQDGLTTLEGTRRGHSIVAAIREQGTAVQLGQTGEDAIAYFDPERNRIVISEGLRDASLNVLVQHLAHEGTHAQWNRPPSIDQEYHAFKAEAEVWNELKGDEADNQCDWVNGVISLGKMRAKWIISDLYPNLPDYA
jgi:non-ribosomal peptide synthetase component F